MMFREEVDDRSLVKSRLQKEEEEDCCCCWVLVVEWLWSDCCWKSVVWGRERNRTGWYGRNLGLARARNGGGYQGLDSLTELKVTWL